MRLLPGLFLLVVSVLTGGCATTAGIAEPRANVIEVSLVDQTAQGARVEVVIELLNPNAAPLPLLKADYSVRVAGVEPFVSSAQPNRTLPGRTAARGPDPAPTPGRQLLRLAAAFATQGQELRGASFQVSGTVTYEPPGEIRKMLTDSGVPLPAVPFTASGVLE